MARPPIAKWVPSPPAGPDPTKMEDGDLNLDFLVEALKALTPGAPGAASAAPPEPAPGEAEAARAAEEAAAAAERQAAADRQAAEVRARAQAQAKAKAEAARKKKAADARAAAEARAKREADAAVRRAAERAAAGEIKAAAEAKAQREAKAAARRAAEGAKAKTKASKAKAKREARAAKGKKGAKEYQRDWAGGLPTRVLAKVARKYVAQMEGDRAAVLREEGWGPKEVQRRMEKGKPKRKAHHLLAFATVCKGWRKGQLKHDGRTDDLRDFVRREAEAAEEAKRAPPEPPAGACSAASKDPRYKTLHCVFFAKGTCIHGAECTFIHDRNKLPAHLRQAPASQAPRATRKVARPTPQVSPDSPPPIPRRDSPRPAPLHSARGTPPPFARPFRSVPFAAGTDAPSVTPAP